MAWDNRSLGGHTECYCCYYHYGYCIFHPSSSICSFLPLPHPSLIFSPSYSFYLIETNRKEKKKLAFSKNLLYIRHHPWWFHMHNSIQSSNNPWIHVWVFPLYRWRNQSLLKSSELLPDTPRALTVLRLWITRASLINYNFTSIPNKELLTCILCVDDHS